MIDQQELADAMGFRDMGEALTHLHQEWSQEAIADLLGVAKPTVGAWLRQWGIKPRRKGCGKSGDKGDYGARLRSFGSVFVKQHGDRELAEMMGCAIKTVNYYRNLWGWKRSKTKTCFSISI